MRTPNSRVDSDQTSVIKNIETAPRCCAIQKRETSIEGLHDARVVNDASVLKGKGSVDRELAGTCIECYVVNSHGRASRNVRNRGRAERGSLRLQVWNGGGVPIGRSIPIATGRVQTPSGRWMRAGIGGNGVRWSGIRGCCARSEHGNSKRSTNKFGDYLHVFSSFIILLRDLPGEVPENLRN